MYTNNTNKIQKAIEYINDQLKELNRRINDTYYYEDPAGNLVRDNFVYRDERNDLLVQKDRMETLLSILNK